MSVGRQTPRERTAALEQEMEGLRYQLSLLIGGDRQRLMAEDVYRLSVKLDKLIVKYMKAYV